jgi:hypothetical protein
MPEIQDEMALARQAGRLAAELFDRELRQIEQAEREERLGRLAWEAGGEAAGEPLTPATAASEWRLQQDLARLAAFHRAVLGSRAWRVVQWARRPFGRAW